MQGKWFRKAPIDAFGSGDDIESWELTGSKGRVQRRHVLNVTTGKDVDMFAIKPSKPKDFIAAVHKVRKSRERFFKGRKANVLRCPICMVSSEKSVFRLEIYGGRYHQCGACNHSYIINRPSQEEVDDFYSNSTYHSTYTDKRLSARRIKEIYTPKAHWVLEAYKRIHGRSPRSILDIGAGAGHFVHACRELGVKASGVELSQASRDSCREQFGFELDNCDITKDWGRYKGFDVVTFWGVIEHVTSPTKLLRSAYHILQGQKGLVVCEVPHWNCMSTVLQEHSPHIVVRHLDPLGHINCFTETSLITAYERSGFLPRAAWYYGTDHYEAITHLLYKLKDDRVVKELRGMINHAQNIYDRGRLSDLLILAAVPGKTQGGS